MINNEPIQKKHIFIIGLHRSGTTLLADCLKQHPDVSGFENTGFPKDEGQFLQTVFPIAATYGGPGKFGFDNRTHLSESSLLLSAENNQKLHDEWNVHWDLTKEYLLEKSPPNITKTRFLQKIFPNSYFILIQRHPIAVSYATKKWSHTSIEALLSHWLVCHNIFLNDKKFLKNAHIVKYENLVKNPSREMNDIYSFTGLKSIDNTKLHYINIQKNINEKYFTIWRKEYKSISLYKKMKYKFINYKLKSFGYSLNV